MRFFGDLFSGLFGSGGSSSAVNNPYMTSTAHMQAKQAYLQAQMQAQIHAQRYGVGGWSQQQGAGTGGLMGAMSKSPEMFRIDQDLYALQRYTETCGDELEIVEIVEGEEVTDEKIALLKIATVGRIVKGVGMKISDTKYAVVREVI